jgi:hypothetical protein
MIIDSVVIILIVTVAKQTLILLCLVLLRMLALLAFIFVFNTTISNISAISWRSVLVVEEAGEHGENHDHSRQATGKLYHSRLQVEGTLFVINKAGRQPMPYW